jgi:hypothetical protein
MRKTACILSVDAEGQVLGGKGTHTREERGLDNTENELDAPETTSAGAKNSQG